MAHTHLGAAFLLDILVSSSPSSRVVVSHRRMLYCVLDIASKDGIILSHAGGVDDGFFKSMSKVSASQPLANYPVEVQQQIIVEDLLSVVAGYEGKYIRVTTKSQANTIGEGTGSSF